MVFCSALTKQRILSKKVEILNKIDIPVQNRPTSIYFNWKRAELSFHVGNVEIAKCVGFLEIAKTCRKGEIFIKIDFSVQKRCR